MHNDIIYLPIYYLIILWITVLDDRGLDTAGNHLYFSIFSILKVNPRELS